MNIKEELARLERMTTGEPRGKPAFRPSALGLALRAGKLHEDGVCAGGVTAKLEAAGMEQCRVVVVRRPALPAGRTHADVESLVSDIMAALP